MVRVFGRKKRSQQDEDTMREFTRQGSFVIERNKAKVRVQVGMSQRSCSSPSSPAQTVLRGDGMSIGGDGNADDNMSNNNGGAGVNGNGSAMYAKTLIPS
eukprot:gnl/TRDRNA2_/TRDRNA2_90316_c0_seq2.p2 gnl/TRDRNA2_/TRDRNA2_90316_c0~~gnl/TRDRNA2_/TRDRNA2_90316_c0_seq2.p2  ORF type:complete len:100 (+),score=22.83 gnl/TRDRNA2_/TRDRNA2_90316_c0_seq2:3-302(+)